MAQVILVNDHDLQIGAAEKLDAHRRGLLHRAFSVFLFQGDRLLIQRRAVEKYHCGGLWSNTCCSHPAPGETVQDAAARRLREELDINGVPLWEVGHSVYRFVFPNGLTEFEYDHILLGEYGGSCCPDPSEVSAVQWASVDGLQRRMASDPRLFTPWLRRCLPIVFRTREQGGDIENIQQTDRINNK